ncbi:MAG: response regulator [Bacteroidales bacterium]|nr:response regulator [Bacteroidales bacterium]
MQLTAVIVDDERHSLESTCILIRRFCPCVSVVGQALTPEKGIELIDTLKPGLVILDITMPRMSGLKLLQKLTFSGFRLILTTACDMNPLPSWNGNKVDCLLKPFDPGELIEAVNRIP